MLIRWVKNVLTLCSCTLESRRKFQCLLFCHFHGPFHYFFCVCVCRSVLFFFFFSFDSNSSNSSSPTLTHYTRSCLLYHQPIDNLYYRFWKFSYSLTALSVPMNERIMHIDVPMFNIKSMKSHSFYCSWIFAY